MSLHKDGEQNILEMLFHKKHKQGWLIMENAFGILKKTFRKCHEKTKIQILTMFDLITCYCLLHNFLIGWHEIDVE
jgi:hypothetical protein